MLDIKFVRQNPELVKENIKKKFQDSKLVLVDEVLAIDEELRQISSLESELKAYTKILSFTDAIDIYLKQDNNFVLYKTMEATDIIEITGRELYLIYVAPQNIVADEPLNIYNKVSNKLQITVEPQNATYSKFKYSLFKK